jgi:hypothetical protein
VFSADFDEDEDEERSGERGFEARWGMWRWR